MIFFRTSITNPFWKDKYNDFFKSYFTYSKSVSKNKVFELEISRHFYYILELVLVLRITGEDHAGPRLDINIFGYELSVKIYDTRHWDHEKNDWMKYDLQNQE